jgi:LacI family transcriptional regulator
MNVTLVDVASRTKLNKSTVSRILNGKEVNCTPATRERVLSTAAEMGYRPNMMARALQTGKTNAVALWSVVPTHYSPYYGTLLHHLQRNAEQHDYHIITETVRNSHGFSGKDIGGKDIDHKDIDHKDIDHKDIDHKDIGHKPLSWPVDGIITSYLATQTIDALRSSVKKDCPLLCVQQHQGEEVETRANTDFLLIDVYAGARQAVGHLLVSGCSRIAFVSEPYIYGYDLRALAYREMLGEAGQTTEWITTTGGTRRCAFESIKAHIDQFGCPDGIFCPNDEFAVGCYLAMQKAGIRVPDDALIVGFDGLENAELFPCPISSVVVPLEQICALAWEMLMERINNPGRDSQQCLVTPNLEARESSRR